MSLYAKYRQSNRHDESDALTPPSGKCTLQLVGLLFLALSPILAMVVQNAIILNEVSENRIIRRAASREISFSTYIGRAVHNLAVERGATSLFLGSRGDTDVYQGLLRKYEDTDMAIADLPSWPDVTAETPWYFRNPENFQRYLAHHRSDVWFKRNQTTVTKEILFYTAVTEKFISDMGRTLSRADTSQLWTTVVAYQMVVSAKDYAGLERALGSVFFAQGGFSSSELIWYDKVLEVGNSNLKDAITYSDRVVQILEQFRGTALEANISSSRERIKTNQIARASVEAGAEWFDLMTQYIGFLRQVEQHLSERVLDILQHLLAQDDVQLATGYTILLTVVSIGPFIVMGVYKMASEAQAVAANLENITAKLELEKKKSDKLLYRVFPAIVVNAMKKADTVPAEYFDEVTIMFSDIVGFTERTAAISPHKVIDLLNRLYHTFDVVLGRYDVYKVESIAGAYMVASGLPTKNGDHHGEQIACAALHLMKAARSFHPVHVTYPLELRIGIHTANRIQISPSTRELLMTSRESFLVEPRGDVIPIKDGVTMKTYWLNLVKTQGPK
ncbi:NPR2 [Branchiostoma lanceolatum]|uniref:NPR2 protein n=1 Tax=Branchiostoma lanceolatum TaxID=7740 RepID=A0A8J9VT86_BRALA|nr:NPR2 [Branchiostoma lanceolatum]